MIFKDTRMGEIKGENMDGVVVQSRLGRCKGTSLKGWGRGATEAGETGE